MSGESLGFKNYATSGVVITLDSDKEEWSQIQARIKEHLDAWPKQPEGTRLIWETREEWAAAEYADDLKAKIESECLADRDISGKVWGRRGYIAAHLIQVGLGEIDFREIALYWVTRVCEGA